VAGIGNIYADEACFLAKIKPIRRTESLNDKERSTIYKAVVKTLQKGIDNMGTSFSDFADLFGKPGQNQTTLMVYGRSGESCRVCKTMLQSTKVGQRTTVWCPKCQK
jgi:formamidopyrimidine-DNA glycosylase